MFGLLLLDARPAAYNADESFASPWRIRTKLLRSFAAWRSRYLLGGGDDAFDLNDGYIPLQSRLSQLLEHFPILRWSFALIVSLTILYVLPTINPRYIRGWLRRGALRII